ncbi:hypothetical protein FQA39_LY17349 [Lamprigera yunnana]|nr:hypothetical protein FQA39_LY17349 [Lamprigera yunnana]
MIVTLNQADVVIKRDVTYVSSLLEQELNALTFSVVENGWSNAHNEAITESYHHHSEKLYFVDVDESGENKKITADLVNKCQEITHSATENFGCNDRQCKKYGRHEQLEKKENVIDTQPKSARKSSDDVFVMPEIGAVKKVKATWLPKKKYLETNLPAAQDYVSEEYEVEENAAYELEQGQESGLNFQESQRIDDEVGLAEQSLDAVKVLRNKKQKRFTNTPSQQMLEILKESAELRKRKYEEKNSIQQKSRPSSIFENLDDADVFFLSMAKMTKKLPKYEQAQIKLALRNLVLSADIRFAHHSSERCLPNQMQTHSDYFASPSSIDSVQPISLPSDYSSLDNEYSTNRTTLLEMTSFSDI